MRTKKMGKGRGAQYPARHVAGKAFKGDVLEEATLRVRPSAGQLNGGTGRQGQARKGPSCQAKELKLGGEVAGRLQGS